MRYILDNGYTSINTAKVIAQCMINEKVSNNYVFVTKHFLVKNKAVAEKTNSKYIYMSYDGEGIVADGSCWDEAKVLSSNEPELIITVSRTAYKFYKRLGFNTYYCRIGYDDINYKRLDLDRDVNLSCAWTMDEERYSTFYHRFNISKDVSFVMKKWGMDNYTIANNIPYHELNRMYSKSILGLNDVVRNTNDRCYTIPVNGAVMLVNEQIRRCDYPLTEGKHYIVYESTLHLLQLIDKMIANKEKTIKMGEKARQEALKHPQSKYVIKMIDEVGLR